MPWLDELSGPALLVGPSPATQVHSPYQEANLKVQIGYSSSMSLDACSGLHRVKAIFTNDPLAPARYGRSPVLKLESEPQLWRHGPITVAYGRATPALLNILRSSDSKVLVLVTDGETKSRKSGQIIERLVQSGRTYVEVIIRPGDAGLISAASGAAEVTPLSIPGSTA